MCLGRRRLLAARSSSRTDSKTRISMLSSQSQDLIQHDCKCASKQTPQRMGFVLFGDTAACEARGGFTNQSPVSPRKGEQERQPDTDTRRAAASPSLGKPCHTSAEKVLSARMQFVCWTLLEDSVSAYGWISQQEAARYRQSRTQPVLSGTPVVFLKNCTAVTAGVPNS